MNEWEAYVDGSYYNHKVGYGAVIIHKNKVKSELFGSVPEEFSHSRQVGGELFAVIQVVKWCQKENITKITIYFDYWGIQKWVTGDWKTNISLTKNYTDFINHSPIQIHWQKVKSHSGNLWNQRADELAKKGANGIG
ncbi:RNase H family protein [Atribacter laminatus]|uniref:Ribonuclease H n=1 Tax=Atribacter laminatus TaxID=2847778 RepID=A0A7T1F2W1_ATRLM|nr:RNase H family protein [Atribacter laminatus]QPM67735.1 Ribonuclease H [Atribacter laminatus]